MTESAPVLFGEVLFDCFEDGGRVLGGAPFNVAWHLQAFDCRPLLISRVGDDPMGRQIRNTMVEWGMSSAGLQMDSRYPTGVVQVKLRNGQPDFQILAERAWDHIDSRAVPPLQPSLIYHGSLGLRSPVAANSFKELVSRYQAPLFLDVNLRPPWWDQAAVLELIANARWLKISDHELNTLVGQGKDLEAKASRLLQQYPMQLIIVTRGAEGAFAMTGDGSVEQVAPTADIKVVDTVGAGDAFASVSVLGILREWPLGLMLQRAQQFASAVVGQRGATSQDKGIYHCLQQEWGL